MQGDGRAGMVMDASSRQKFRGIQALHENRHLNFYHMDALTDSGRVFDYYYASRNDPAHVKALTGSQRAEGVVIYPILRDDPGRILLIRQYRYPVGAYLYELPAGLIDKGETPEEAAVRELREETGYRFHVCEDVDRAWRRPSYMGAGFTDEACVAVYGWAEERSARTPEDTETIEVLTADRAEVRRILCEERCSLRMAYLMMMFLNADDADPFRMIKDASHRRE